MTPADALVLLTGVTALAYGLELIRRRRGRRAVRRLAAEWRLNFARGDTLSLTPKVARQFPVPGVADLHLLNVIYGVVGDRYRYVFTAEYTIGVVRARRRLRRACVFSEPRQRGHPGEPDGSVVLAPGELTLIEQYRQLAVPAAESGALRRANEPHGGTPAEPC